VAWPPVVRQARETACIEFVFARLIQFLLPPLFGASLEPYMTERPLDEMADVRVLAVSDACLIARYKLLRWLYVNVHDYTQVATDR